MVFQQAKFNFFAKSGFAGAGVGCRRARVGAQSILMRTLSAGILLLTSAMMLPAAKNLEVYAIDVEGRTGHPDRFAFGRIHGGGHRMGRPQ